MRSNFSSSHRNPRHVRLPTIESQLLVWLRENEDKIHGEWLQRAGFKVYLRLRNRVFEGRSQRTLDIANIEIPEKYRGRGWWSTFVALAELASPTELICVEQVRLRFATWFDRTPGWVKDPYLSNYYKRLPSPRPGYTLVLPASGRRVVGRGVVATRAAENAPAGRSS